LFSEDASRSEPPTQFEALGLITPPDVLRHVVANFATFVRYYLYRNDVVDRDPLKEKLMPLNFLQKQVAG